MRRERPEAIAEFYARFAPMLRRLARRWGLADADAEQVATDTLGDVALALMAPEAVLPRALASYVATALRSRLAMDHRGDERRWARERDLETTTGPYQPRSHERTLRVAEPVALRALCSEHALRSSAGPQASEIAAAPHPALLRLVARVEGELRDADRLLLVWTAHHVPFVPSRSGSASATMPP